MMAGSKTPYWRLSSLYFFYYSVVGTLLPYWGLYLKSLDYSYRQIGYVGAMLLVTRIVAPNIWSAIASHSGQALKVMRIGCFLAVSTFSALLFVESFWWVLFFVGLFSFFWSAVLPQFESMTLDYLGQHAHHYSRVRLWGSVGFIVAVIGLGSFLDGREPSVIPVTIFILLLSIWGCSLFLPGYIQSRLQEGPSILSIILQPRVIAFLSAGFLLHFSHGAYYTFFSVYLKGMGYSASFIGWCWALGVIAEIILFLVIHRILLSYNLRSIFAFALVITTVRWWLTACYADNVTVLLFAQLLHAFSFGAAHSVAMQWVRQHFAGRFQPRGQALYSATGFGAGGAAGALVSGLFWDFSPILAFAISAFASAIALLVVWRWMPAARSSQA